MIIIAMEQDDLFGPFYQQAAEEAQKIAAQAAPPCPISVEPDCRNTEQSDFEKENNISPGCGYYRKRYNDFLDRYPGMTPPSYYLEYGEKYCNKFTLETYQKLSDEGKVWFDNVKCGLQQGIDDVISNEKTRHLELVDSLFSRKAFEMHAPTYMRYGLDKLPFSDHWYIGTAPWMEFLPISRNAPATWDQFWDVFPELVPGWANELGESLSKVAPPDDWMYYIH